MSLATKIQNGLPSTCEVNFPAANDTPETYLSHRFMNLGDSTLPAGTVVPSSEEDLVAIVRFATDNGLEIVPKSGGLGCAVKFKPKTLYVDMKKFTRLDMDLEGRVVKVGSGVLVGDVFSALIGAGFYTGTAHYSKVGMVGNLLGGGLNASIGTKGFSCDNLQAARVITGKGETLDLSVDSSGDEGLFFHLLRGAGAGLGIVTEMTIRIYPLADLKLGTNHSFLRATAIFAHEEREAAAKMWKSFSDKPDELFTAFIMDKGPPGTPVADKPVIMLTMQFLGPAEKASALFAKYLTDEVKSQAAVTIEAPMEWAKMNEMSDKTITSSVPEMEAFNALLDSASEQTLLSVAERVASFHTEFGPDIKGHTLMAPMPRDTLMSLDHPAGTGMCHRDRSFMIQGVFWDIPKEHREGVARLGFEILGIARKEDAAKGLPNAAIAGNARVGVDMKGVYDTRTMENVRKIKERFDPRGVIWCASVHGWE